MSLGTPIFAWPRSSPGHLEKFLDLGQIGGAVSLQSHALN